ncbi:MAG: hypothetical protein Q8N05_00030 [Bacteroidota bacterium]|nr:hypothetical protein [Bacteroidota bacterium]
MRIISVILMWLIAVTVQATIIKHNPVSKIVLIADGNNNLQLQIDYSKGCKIGQLNIKGENTISPSGVYTSIKTDKNLFTSLETKTQSKVKIEKNSLEISDIVFGDDEMSVAETWIFTLGDNQILWKIRREYNKNGKLDNMDMPAWNFSKLSTWKGGILNTGGVVWCKYLRDINDTYGVHTDGVTFWEPVKGNGFRVEASSNTGGNIACSFSHSENDEFKFTQYLTPEEPEQRYNLRRFVSKKSDVFAPFEVKSGISEISLKLSYVDYTRVYDRGTLTGIDAIAVRELLNTTGRYGVVDKNIIGSNGWLTNWKVMHEPFFAQIGLAVNDKNYTRNFSSTLNQERDLAIEKDGRVLARWHDRPEAKNSNYNFKTGYYDCPWGYTIDAQPGQVINTTEQFNQNGDLAWLKSHKLNCEKVLNWLIKRDSNNNGIFEMLNDNTGENKCSDWIDVVWASFENAFVNAQMYEALNLWSDCELVLGDKKKSNYYLTVAARLKEAFNKSVKEGGFWLPEKKQYIYWRDKDGSLHGDNLVALVNFAAIAFGICDDPQRVKEILDQIENKTNAENLFHWPLCFESFRFDEVYAPVNWPFPNYENGDIFLTWGYLGIRSYVKYNKNIALKYIRNILQQYSKDGLSSQRYGRNTQMGLGDDILAGNSTTITALFRDIYGIRPKWNRMGLEPNILRELNGTEFNYTLRDQVYHIKLSENSYQITTKSFLMGSKKGFGVNMHGNTLFYYPNNQNIEELSMIRHNSLPINIEIGEWSSNERSWVLNSEGDYKFLLAGLKPNSSYNLILNGTIKQSYRANAAGTIKFEYRCQIPTSFSIVD